MTEAAAQPDASAGRRIQLVLSVTFAFFLCMLNTHAINIALPAIADHFQAGIGMAARVSLIYMVMMTCLLLVFGNLGDRLGLKRMFVSGYALLAAGSLLSGLAPCLGILIAARAIQGVSASMLMAAGSAIIARHLPPDRRGWAFGIQGMFSAAGAALGAPLGGLVTHYAGWQWVFLGITPFCLLAMTLAQKSIPGDRPSAPARQVLASFDWPGAAMSVAGFFLLLYGLNSARQLGWASPVIIGCLAAGVLLLILFAAWERKCAGPLLNIAAFRNRAFACANLAGVAAFMVMSGSNFLMPFYLVLRQRTTAAEAGFSIMLFSAFFLLISPAAGRASDRMHPARISAAGMVCASAACVFFMLALTAPGLAPALVFLGMFGVAYALFVSPNNNLIMSMAPPAMLGSTSAIFGAVNSFGIASGLALFEAIFSAAAAAPPGADAALASGFQTAYGVGALLCMLAFFLSMAAGRAGKRN